MEYDLLWFIRLSVYLRFRMILPGSVASLCEHSPSKEIDFDSFQHSTHKFDENKFLWQLDQFRKKIVYVCIAVH